MLASSIAGPPRVRAWRSNSAALVIRVRSSAAASGSPAAGAAGGWSGRRMRIGFPHLRQVALFTSRVSLESGIL
jgi:hypothetical protein